MTSDAITAEVHRAQYTEQVAAAADRQGMTPDQKREFMAFIANVRRMSRHRGCGGSWQPIERYERRRRPLLVPTSNGVEQLPDALTDKYPMYSDDKLICVCSKCKRTMAVTPPHA